mmetsp:Transcript_9861/g.29778  ORF Transcript_9861/g.29778 Transcript_9861/m.29778 type:complete len:313 (-) Transcript_9861:19-957(-)
MIGREVEGWLTVLQPRQFPVPLNLHVAGQEADDGVPMEPTQAVRQAVIWPTRPSFSNGCCHQITRGHNVAAYIPHHCCSMRQRRKGHGKAGPQHPRARLANRSFPSALEVTSIQVAKPLYGEAPRFWRVERADNDFERQSGGQPGIETADKACGSERAPDAAPSPEHLPRRWHGGTRSDRTRHGHQIACHHNERWGGLDHIQHSHDCPIAHLEGNNFRPRQQWQSHVVIRREKRRVIKRLGDPPRNVSTVGGFCKRSRRAQSPLDAPPSTTSALCCQLLRPAGRHGLVVGVVVGGWKVELGGKARDSSGDIP